jgi:cytochrome P450
LELHRRPDEWRRLCLRPALAGSGIEELLRCSSPVQYVFRLTEEPTRVAGVEIAPGETVFLVLASANRDPGVFVDPDAVDLTRANAKEHLAFGYGPHFCLGSALARLEGSAAFAALARRFPDIEVARDDVTWGGNTMQRAITRLPVRLGRNAGGTP